MLCLKVCELDEIVFSGTSFVFARKFKRLEPVTKIRPKIK